MRAGVRRMAERRRRRRRDRRTDAGSLPLAMLVTIVGVTLSGGLGGLVVGQIRQSQRIADRVAAVNAAQAGLDAGLKEIRKTFEADGADLDELPCGELTPPADAAKNPFQGLGHSTSAVPTYSTTVGYFVTDPSGLVGRLEPLGPLTNINKVAQGRTLPSLIPGLTDPTGLVEALRGAIACAGSDADGRGGQLTQVPLFGLLRSEARVGSTRRTLYATYTFHTSEDNIPGGRVVIANTGGLLCLGDLNGDPEPGDPVSAVPCTSPDKQAKFIYPSNLSLVLADTRTPAVLNGLTGLLGGAAPRSYSYGLCVTATSFSNDAPVVFEECKTTDIAKQQWSYDVNPATYYANDGLAGALHYCLNARTPNTVGSPIVLRINPNAGSRVNCGATGSSQRNFVPDASVGPGGAGFKSKQLVNTEEVGRCLDLTNENVDNDVKALITYPCKQTFSGDVYWNHKWISPEVPPAGYRATGQISTQPPGLVPYCLRSPGVVHGFVWVAKCSDGGANLQWTLFKDAPTYRESYQIVDFAGLCLMPAGSLGTAYRFSGWSEVIVSTCTGKELQKWNMPSAADPSPLKGITER